jgi:hypothetical protein
VLTKTKGKAMDPKKKFAAETVRQLQQSLAGVAPYQAIELSKQQAIRALSPQILSLRSKGYSWTAVAAMLSDHGLPVSVAALRTYLRRVREESADEGPRPTGKRLRDMRAAAREPERRTLAGPSPSESADASPVTNPKQPGTAPAPAVAAQHTPVSAPRRDPEARRTTFPVRPDTEDL